MYRHARGTVRGPVAQPARYWTALPIASTEYFTLHPFLAMRAHLLEVAARVGPYEILSALGAGGMGKVYRADDTKLTRDVALKILPDVFANDPDRLARFQREAQVLASLNHPNIGGIYGLEDADGVRALVLELVEGPTLADRIAQGSIPLDEALPIAKQIAEALEAAHEQGSSTAISNLQTSSFDQTAP